MSTLVDFIKKELNTVDSNGTGLAVASGRHALATTFAATLIQAQVAEGQADKFAKKLTELVAGDQFLKEFSDEIREPGITETEEAFVERCKTTMKKLLDRHLG